MLKFQWRFESFFLVLILLLFFIDGTKAQTFESELPVVVINTNGKVISHDSKITATMGIIMNTDGTLNHPDDPFNNYSGTIGIEYRGQASFILFPKKNFSIETRNTDGTNFNTSLMGLPAENDWILYGPYTDKTLIRNALTFSLGFKTGHYGSRCIFSELFINDNYLGLYVLMEKIKIDKNRVRISKLDPDDNGGDSLTGGYILKLDKEFDGLNGWTSKFKVAGKNVNIMYHDPKYADLTAQQKTYIKGYMDNFEAILNGPNFADPVNGYRKYIDVNSFIDYFLINELTRNVDSYQISAFFYKQRDSKGGKLVMGPLWDYDYGWGLCYYSSGYKPNGWIKDGIIDNVDDWPIPFWWDKLLQDESYRNQLKCRWIELRATILSDNSVLNTIDSMVNVMGSSIDRNFNKWDIINESVPPNKYIAGSFESEVQYVKDWAQDRLKWMDENLYGDCPGTNLNQPLQTMEKYNVYPNPFDDFVTVKIQTQEYPSLNINISDVTGRLMYNEILPYRMGESYEYSIRLAKNGINLPSGIYLLTITSNSQIVYINKIVKR